MKGWDVHIRQSLKKINNKFASIIVIMANSVIALRVGVLIPTFNRVRYLQLAIKSVLSQSYCNFEIIVIDNGSTDGTAEFMADVSDPRVRYIVNDQNLGMIGSINKGVNLFSDTVEWCTVLSDDDVLDKNFIMNLVLAAASSDAKTVIHSHRIFIDKDGNRIREASLPPQEETASDYIIMRANFKRETYLTGVMFNRKAFLAIKGYPAFETGWSTDDAFIFALSLKDCLYFARDAVAYIRIHEEAESKVFSEGIRKLKTFQQFGEYCKKVAQDSAVFDKKQYAEFEESLKKYISALNSLCWIQSTHHALLQENANHEQLAELISFAKNNPDRFTFRVKFAVACHTLTGIFPEGYAAYRALWKNLTKLTLVVK